MADADTLVSGTVKLPGIGQVKKGYVYAGVGVIGVAVAYWMYSRQKAAAADVTPADAELGDGLTTPPGSDVYQGARAGGQSSGDSDITPMPRTNQEWTSQVTEHFNWLEPGYVSSVVGKYLGRIPLSSEEADFIRQAWAAKGKPPEGPDNFTLSNDGNTPGAGAAPSVPAGLAVTASTDSSITLDWVDSPDATGYQVFRNGDQVGTPAASTYTDSGLATNTAYSYTVKATNGAKTSAASAAIAAKTGGGDAVVAPVVQGLKLGSSTTSSLSFSWDYGPTKPDYQLIYLNNQPIANVGPSDRGYVARNLKKGTRYTFQVRGVKGATMGSTATTYGTTRSK